MPADGALRAGLPGRYGPFASSPTLHLSAEQLHALVIGLPWHRLGEEGSIRIL